ncbi:NERD domain-containing protein [Crenobacter cavernae]|uniref:NERD domain-containing protein n=1 Tax=Crenobacter cavernae TaxID=2290923 RepID=UPI00196B04E2|nr:NERD domain-containing protein/DEAD/DEAH box helicase [Crenobacter cavernae]
MAQIFPSPHLPHVRMTPGERRLAARLLGKLESDYLCWFNVPIGTRQLKPDYIVLHPARGLLVLEVKDWLLSTIHSVDRHSATLLTERGLVTQVNPLEQARHYAEEIARLLERDALLVVEDGKHRGKLVLPWGYGVVLSRISRRQFLEAGLDQAIDENRVICQDEMLEDVDAEQFQARLWSMFNYCYGTVLSLARVDRIRWHLFPEVRVQAVTAELFDDEPPGDAAKYLPDLVKVMDLQQEQLARNLGEGHRVVHGVAGSGKTLILAYRCLHLSEAGRGKPILVLCYNRTLAARLSQILKARGAGDTVHIYNFHQWCRQQLDLYQIDMPLSSEPGERYRLMVEAVMKGGRLGAGAVRAILGDPDRRRARLRAGMVQVGGADDRPGNQRAVVAL